jgi:hypothetical protein
MKKREGETPEETAARRAGYRNNRKKWHAKNKEKAKTYAKKWQVKNREKLRAYQRKWVAKNRGKMRGYQRKWVAKNVYGVTWEQVEAQREFQHHQCAICFSPFNYAGRAPHIDHDHVTGRVRGLLCGKCNPGLGYFNDDYALLASAARYLMSDPVWPAEHLGIEEDLTDEGPHPEFMQEPQ